ncbi:hypothetical protein, partial [Micromonospora sp. NPDC048169]|uniref:hypothetical protein n=1 Tax=Micromonospora sp. NPDC048169 TaxID=3154711 RepID=UPI0033D1BA5C
MPRKVDLATGKEIRVDFHLRENVPVVLTQENIEAKTGALEKKRDLEQLRGYEALCRRGETVHLFTRAERDKEMSRDAQALLAAMKARYPTRFVHRSMNERVYNRIMEAGARALERERHAAL